MTAAERQRRHRSRNSKPVTSRLGEEYDAAQERPADLTLWLRDGEVWGYKARVAAEVKVSIGRTNSERGLGFIVSSGKKKIDFVLDRDQVAELAAYLQHHALPRLRAPLGRKQEQISFASLTSPKVRLQKELEKAAMRAHPGWHARKNNGFEVIEVDADAPGDVVRLVAWFKKTHPRDAERIERDFIKKMLS